MHSPAGAPVIMGQTRLSVVSKAPVLTPFQRGTAILSFNGEIYNWRALREELEAKGHVFETQTDTEVVLVACQVWGPGCLERFNGMFAFAYWDGRTLLLARDRLGKKPLFYTRTPRGLAFASELKVFAQHDFSEVPICQSLEFYFDEYTPFRNIESVRPGEYALYEPDTGELTTRRWWSFPLATGEIQDEKRALDEVIGLLEDACRIRKVADVPVTLFLSGGVDSSLLQAILRLEKTYTIQFPEFEGLIDERPYVEELGRALGFDPQIVMPTRELFFEHFGDLARCIEFPVGSFSVFPLYCLTQSARQGGFVVALSGEGADELFNGYYRNALLLREAASIEQDFRGPYGALCGRYFGSPLERFCRMASRKGLAGVDELVQLFEPRWMSELTFGQNISRIESTVFLQPLLVMADRLSMGNSLEVRNPFLDHRVIELSTRLADNLKFRDGEGKWILRRALRKLLGQDLGVTTRKVKHGMPAPVNQWLFKRDAFERKDWNHVLLGECLKQLVRAHDIREEMT